MITPLIVEDGTGLPNADSYVSVLEVNKYFSDRPNHTLTAAWNATTDDNKISSIRIATENLDAMYSYKYPKLTSTQALRFPVVGIEGIPLNVKKASAELAARAVSGTLLEDNDGREVESEKYDVVEFKYKTTGVPASKVFPAVKTLMKDYINDSLLHTINLCR